LALREEPMNGRTQSSSGLDERRRKLSFRSWHRGMREVDLIMGRFADAVLGQLTEQELDEFERLIEVPDCDLLAWVTGEAEVPADFDTALFRRLREFNYCRERPR
jgi:antitoxin CptB